MAHYTTSGRRVSQCRLPTSADLRFATHDLSPTTYDCCGYDGDQYDKPQHTACIRAAAAHLVEKAGGVVAGFTFVVELEFLNGREKIEGYDVFSLIQY